MSITSDPTVLQNATPAQLEWAVALNHRELFCLTALAANGEVQELDGVTWTNGGATADSMLTFFSLAEERAGQQIDAIVAYYLQHNSSMVGCWSLDPPRPADLGIQLLARGFQPGWRPCWMALDLHTLQPNHPTPTGLKVIADNAISLHDVKDLPYANVGGAGVYSTLVQRYPGRLQRFVAMLDNKVVAHSALLFTTGAYGVAGIYNVGVVPTARKQGIGRAVTLAACLYAQARGYHYAVLNATEMGRGMYAQLGFQWLGDGWTWWLNVPRVRAQPPTKAQIVLAEAVGWGDLATLEQVGAQFSTADLQTPMANQMTLLQLAIDAGQPAAATWLVAHGVALTVLAAWDLGWHDHAAQLLAAQSEQINQRYGEWAMTLLHVAAQRNDVPLARLALCANPDLTIQDATFHSTPLGWAKYFQRAEIVQLIEKYQAG